MIEEHELAQALRNSEGRYRTLYNDTPVMLHSIDNDGRLVAVNDHWPPADPVTVRVAVRAAIGP